MTLSVTWSWGPTQNPTPHELESYKTSSKVVITSKVQGRLSIIFIAVGRLSKNITAVPILPLLRTFTSSYYHKIDPHLTSKTHAHVYFNKNIFKKALSSQCRSSLSTTGSLLPSGRSLLEKKKCISKDVKWNRVWRFWKCFSLAWAKINIKKYIFSAKWNSFLQFSYYFFALLLPKDSK